jgi:molybdopterin-binding protein
MKLSARNVLKGRVVQVVRGKTTGHVKLDVGGGTPRPSRWRRL